MQINGFISFFSDVIGIETSFSVCIFLSFVEIFIGATLLNEENIFEQFMQLNKFDSLIAIQIVTRNDMINPNAKNI